MMKSLNKKERRELIDLLRKNVLYQTPRPIFVDQNSHEPTHVELRFVYPHYQQILALINKAGGWTLSEQDKLDVIRKHERVARVANDGVKGDYDLSQMTYGDLVAIYNELEGIDEMTPFRSAIKDELLMWQEKGLDQ